MKTQIYLLKINRNTFNSTDILPIKTFLIMKQTFIMRQTLSLSKSTKKGPVGCTSKTEWQEL